MCGICGVVSNQTGDPIELSALLNMRDTLKHRGPDDAGYFLRDGIAIGSCRLAILDLSHRAHMPMCTEDRRYWITYNGEIYNYRYLKAELQSRGHTFRSTSDTEVVLNAYREYGPLMLDRFNGMFALAIWDAQERTLFVARDRLGVKPLYYAQHADKFYFASEHKAIFAAGVPRQFDPDTWEELLCFRYVAGTNTPFAGVKRLLPGHQLFWKDGKIRVSRWWKLADKLDPEAPSDAVEWFSRTFDDAVNLRRISDVPVGVLLSGGLDSSSVAASLSQQSDSPVASFTVRFDEAAYDEGPLAQQVATKWNLDRHELRISPNELPELLIRASTLNDEPLVHGNDLYLFAIAKHAKPLVTVLLSGEGGDETLGGYVRYRPLLYPNIFKIAQPIVPRVAAGFRLKGRLGKLNNFFKLGSIDDFILFNACEVLPSDLLSLGMRPQKHLSFRRQVLDEARGAYPNDYLRQAMYSDQHTFLPSILDRNDRMTMGASIECRVPFLDFRLVETLAKLKTSALIGRQNKHLLRKALGHRLPQAVLQHKKWGFAVPWNFYLRSIPGLREMVHDLPGLEPIAGGPFDPGQVRKQVQAFLKGDTQHDLLIKQLLMIAIWHHACISSVHNSKPSSLENDRVAVPFSLNLANKNRTSPAQTGSGL